MGAKIRAGRQLDPGYPSGRAAIIPQNVGSDGDVTRRPTSAVIGGAERRAAAAHVHPGEGAGAGAAGLLLLSPRCRVSLDAAGGDAGGGEGCSESGSSSSPGRRFCRPPASSSNRGRSAQTPAT